MNTENNNSLIPTNCNICGNALVTGEIRLYVADAPGEPLTAICRACTMKTIEVVPITRYWFKCSECGGGTELLDKPDKDDVVFCDDCGQGFKPIVMG